MRPGAIEMKVHRCMWLGFELTAGTREVNYERFAARFGATMRTYRRDLALLRRIGFTLVSERDHLGNVRCTEVAL